MSKEITIAGVAFTLSAPYAAGQTMTDAEAAALNQVRAENIGNNVRKAIDAAKVADADGNKSVPPDAMQTLLALVAQKDAEYVFNMASARVSKAIASPLEKECLALAKAKLTQMLAAAGTSAKDYGKDRAEAKIAEIAVHPEVVKLAQRNLDARAKAGADITL